MLPLDFLRGDTRDTYSLTGEEIFSIAGISESYTLRGASPVYARRAGGSAVIFEAQVRVDTPQEVEYFRNGGIFPYVLRQLSAAPGHVSA